MTQQQSSRDNGSRESEHGCLFLLCSSSSASCAHAGRRRLPPATTSNARAGCRGSWGQNTFGIVCRAWILDLAVCISAPAERGGESRPLVRYIVRTILLASSDSPRVTSKLRVSPRVGVSPTPRRMQRRGGGGEHWVRLTFDCRCHYSLTSSQLPAG